MINTENLVPALPGQAFQLDLIPTESEPLVLLGVVESVESLGFDADRTFTPEEIAEFKLPDGTPWQPIEKPASREVNSNA